jgi:hypothetical protein
MRKTSLACVAALAVLAVAGCGGEKAAVETVTVTESIETTPTTASASGAACREVVGALLQSEKDLWARLGVGVIYADYVKAVGDLSVADGRIGPISDPECVGVRRQLRGALLYFKRAAVGGWFCGDDPGCYRAKQNRQIKWQKAHARLNNAEQLLAAMG